MDGDKGGRRGGGREDRVSAGKRGEKQFLGSLADIRLVHITSYKHPTTNTRTAQADQKDDEDP